MAAHLVHHGLHVFVANTKAVIGEHPTGVGNRHIREGLPDDGNLHTTALVKLIGFELGRGLVPHGVKNILAQGIVGQAFDQFAHPVLAQREFPVEGHRIRLKRVHHVDHVLAFGLIAGVRPVPGVATVQQQGIRPRRADRLYDSRHTIKATDLAVFFAQGREIIVRQGIVAGAAILDAIKFAEIRAGDMRHLALVAAHTDVDLRLTEINRLKLRVDVGHVDQAHVAESVKFQKLVLGQGLLRCQFRPIAKAACAIKRRGRHADLKKIATRDHVIRLRLVKVVPLPRPALRMRLGRKAMNFNVMQAAAWPGRLKRRPGL